MLNYAVNKYHKHENTEGIIQDFGLTPGLFCQHPAKRIQKDLWMKLFKLAARDLNMSFLTANILRNISNCIILF